MRWVTKRVFLVFECSSAARTRYPRPKSNRRRRALVRAVKQEAKRWVAEVMATEAVDKTSEVAKQELWWHRW